ncbi:MAG TPA: transposase [Chloroflexia bacterium]|nr:transposase [Chloroflexia bacterium]
MALGRYAGARRWVFNWALATRRGYYAHHGKTLPRRELMRQLTALKKREETRWLRDIDSQLLQQAVSDLDRAFLNFFEKRARFPHFKSKKDPSQSFRIPQRCVLNPQDAKGEGKGKGKVYLPKVGHIKVKQHRPVEGKTRSATFKRDCTGNWHITLVCQVEMPDAKAPSRPETTVGIDLGFASFATVTNGTDGSKTQKIPSQKHMRRAARKLRRVQRSFSRKKKGSNNRVKQRLVVARTHRKVANQRNDFLHKQSHALVKSNSAICVEELSLRGMARTKLARSVHDAGLGSFVRMLEYKCLWEGKHFVKISRWFPSSKLCRMCGALKSDLTLRDREWVCECGTVHDRDINAAHNIRTEGMRILRSGVSRAGGSGAGELGILAVGHTESVNACGAFVRPPVGGKKR